MTFGELLSRLIDGLADLWPLSIVAEWEQGIRLRNGTITAVLGAGLHWYWPIIGEIITEEVVTRVVETDIQTVNTIDGKPATVSLGIKYRIKDLRRLYQKVDEFELTVLELARSTVGLLVPSLRWEELATSLIDEVEKAVRSRMHGWGIEIQEIAPITLTCAPAIRLLQDGSE